MMPSRNHCSAALFICAFSFGAVTALRCFQCNSVSDPGCVNLTSTDTNSEYYKECNKTSLGRTPIFCRKTVLSFNDDKDAAKRITRSCGWEVWKTNNSNCLEVDSDFKFERSCQCFTDGCNTASSLTLHYVALLATSAFLLIYRLVLL